MRGERFASTRVPRHKTGAAPSAARAVPLTGGGGGAGSLRTRGGDRRDDAAQLRPHVPGDGARHPAGARAVSPNVSRISGRPVTAPRIGVIAAAGKGRRIHPRSARVPKVLLEVAGKPLLVRNIELLREALGIREVVLVVGRLGNVIRARLGVGSGLG